MFPERQPEFDAVHLMILDKDPIFGSVLAGHLKGEGHVVDWIRCLPKHGRAIQGKKYDCLLVSLDGPDLDVTEQLQSIRSQLSNCPCLVMTPCRSQVDQAALLDRGADDTLAKPVDLREVSARIRAIVRRVESQAALRSEILVGPLRIDPSSWTAVWKDRPVVLTKKEFRVLEALTRHRNQILSRSRLEESIYGSGESMDSNTVEVYIHNLRRKLDRRLIVTFKGLGYKLGCAESLS
jgi:DNA-binding response OmpR family regulator